ncbi:MAG: hypothetical protein ACLUW6_01795 [Coriobacteriaceae bacterium]
MNALCATADSVGISTAWIGVARRRVRRHGRGFARYGPGVSETLDLRHPVAGKRVVVLGRSLVIGRPVAMMLWRATPP